MANQQGRRLFSSSERSGKATAIAFARVFIGVFWIFEVTVGHNWKIGGFGSGVNPGWLGPGAGDAVRENIATAVEDGTWAWVAWLYETVIAPNAAGFSYLVIALQVALGLFFIFGFAVRPMAVLAITMDLSIFFLGNSRIPPFFTVAHLFLLYTGAGRYYGVDGWIMNRLQDARHGAARFLRWLIDLPLLKSSASQVAVMSGAVLLTAYFFMQVAMRETTRMNLVSMELAVLFGLVAAGFYFGRQAADRLAVVAALLRIFIGYKLLHEIWVRVDPGVNALPGWAGVEAQRELFETIAANHWNPFAWIAENAILPALGLWVVLFGIVQFGVGVALVLGFRTRIAAAVGLVYLGGLGVLGFNRYAPFVFGLLVVVLALDSGRALSLDARRLADQPPRSGLPVPRAAIPVLIVLAAVNAVAAGIAVVATGGIAPDGYVQSMGQMTTAMVAIFSALFALGGWLQLRAEKHPPLEPGLEREVVDSSA
jgi:uncharacterized membrane protein YphA (DoxX/SURF4 family)